MARTLMCNPKLIILDEPAAGLNDVETQQLAETIYQVRDKYHCTVLLVEHDMRLVMSICDRICAISFGKMLAIGTPSTIYNGELSAESERRPRIRTVDVPPGSALSSETCTPAAAPRSISPTLVVGVMFNFSAETDTIEPVTSLRRCVP